MPGDFLPKNVDSCLLQAPYCVDRISKTAIAPFCHCQTLTHPFLSPFFKQTFFRVTSDHCQCWNTESTTFLERFDKRVVWWLVKYCMGCSIDALREDLQGIVKSECVGQNYKIRPMRLLYNRSLHDCRELGKFHLERSTGLVENFDVISASLNLAAHKLMTVLLRLERILIRWKLDTLLLRRQATSACYADFLATCGITTLSNGAGQPPSGVADCIAALISEQSPSCTKPRSLSI